MIVVLDASTFVSAAIKPESIPELTPLKVLSPGNRLIMSEAVDREFRDVIFRKKFDRFVSIERRRRILDLVLLAADRIEPDVAVYECRDKKDDKYLALAWTGSADIIVSSDQRHLLSMHPWRGIPILSPAAFVAL